MGSKDYDTFKSDLEFNLGGHDDLSSYTGGWINAAYLDFCAKNKFFDGKYYRPDTFSLPDLDTTDEQITSDGQEYIYIPTDTNGKRAMLFAHDLWDKTNDNILDWISPSEYRNKTGREDTDNENEPKYWTEYGNKLYLYPTPDDEYNIVIYYRKLPLALSGGTDVTAIGREWDEPILDLATIYGLKHLKMYEEMKLWRDEWIDMMKDRLGAYDKHRKRARKKFRMHPLYMAGLRGK